MRKPSLIAALLGLWFAVSGFSAEHYAIDIPPGWRLEESKDGDFRFSSADGHMILNLIAAGPAAKMPQLSEILRQVLPGGSTIAEQRYHSLAGQSCLHAVTRSVNPRGVAVVTRYMVCYMPARGGGRPIYALIAFLTSAASLSAQNEHIFWSLLSSLRWAAASRG